MTYTMIGLTVLALSFMLRRRLDLEFRSQRHFSLLALGGFLLGMFFEAIGLTFGDRLGMAHLSSAFGWLMLIIALIVASGAYRPTTGEAADPGVREYMRLQEEKIRQEIRERFAERDAQPGSPDQERGSR